MGMKEGLGNTEMNSTTGFGDTGSKEAAIWVTGSVRADAGLYDGADRVRSVGIDNTTALYGYRVQAGSTSTANSASGLVLFGEPFADANWFMCLTVGQMSDSYDGMAIGSNATPLVSGTRRASGCWIVAGSKTVVDWIAVGL